MLCVILRHCFKSGCFAPLFLPERLKIETFMLSECTFPPGSVQLWVSDIGCAPSRGSSFLGCHWLAPVGLCEEKLFWQDPGAQRSCWKLGEGQCRWNQESSREGAEGGGGGGAWEMASPWLWAWRCWDVTSQPRQRAGIHRDGHMAEEENEWGAGEDDDLQQWHSDREHVSSSYISSADTCHPVSLFPKTLHLSTFHKVMV